MLATDGGDVRFIAQECHLDVISTRHLSHLRARLYTVVAAAIGSGLAIQLGIAAPAHSLPFAHFANTRPVARAQPN